MKKNEYGSLGGGSLGAGTEVFAKFEDDVDWRPYTLLSLSERKGHTFRILTWSESGKVFKSAEANFEGFGFANNLVKIKALGKSYFGTPDQEWFIHSKEATPVRTRADLLKSGSLLCIHPKVNANKPEKMTGGNVLDNVFISSLKNQEVNSVWVGRLLVHDGTNFLLTSGLLAGSAVRVDKP